MRDSEICRSQHVVCKPGEFRIFVCGVVGGEGRSRGPLEQETVLRKKSMKNDFLTKSLRPSYILQKHMRSE